MSGVFQLLGTLRNRLRCTLRHLRQQLRHSLRASKIRLRRTVRTDFLLRVPAALVLVICAAPGVRCRWPSPRPPADSEKAAGALSDAGPSGGCPGTIAKRFATLRQNRTAVTSVS